MGESGFTSQDYDLTCEECDLTWEECALMWEECDLTREESDFTCDQSGRNVSSPVRTYLTCQECDLTWDGFPIYGEEDEDGDTDGRQQKHQTKSYREENGHVIPVYNGWNKHSLDRTNN